LAKPNLLLRAATYFSPCRRSLQMVSILLPLAAMNPGIAGEEQSARDKKM
jgi:hypothetical protein